MFLYFFFSHVIANKQELLNKKIINDVPLSTPEAIPLSIGVGQMTRSGDITCSANTCPQDNNLPEGTYNINSPTFYRCGSICNTSSGRYGYQFKGVKFGIIGTKTTEYHSFIVEVDGRDQEISTYKETREEYSLLYVSEDLEYKEHTINIKGNGEPFELYKFVYWPTLNAKRLNSSEFKERVGTWNTQSDMVGGIRQYAFEDGSTDSISTTISFSKVWIYGSKCSWCESFDLSIGDIDTKLELKDGNEGERFDTVLLYESDEFIADDYKLKLLSSGDATINCIYYIESTSSTPKPTPKAIPLSIGLGQMTQNGNILCSSNTCPSDDNLPEGTYDINSPEFYRCGTICNTSSGTFGYQFKGVKFGIIGTASPKSYSFTIDIDGENTRVNTHKATINEYSLLYVSDNLEYKEHTINIKGNDELIELYKVVYWPSLIARRLNSSEFKERVGTWNTQSDMVGGIRQYAFEDGSTDSIKTNIWTSHIWIYGTKCSWCESFDLSIGDINTKLELREGNQGERFDTLLLYENDQLSLNYYDITLKSSGDATINCVYYIDLPSPPPSPTPEAIPLSIGVGQMTRSEDITCSANTCPQDHNLQEGTYDLNSPEFYRCGSICNTSSGRYGYQFKGVKFGIIGTKTTEYHSFVVEVDGRDQEISTYKETREEYSLLYVSEDLEYKEHTINIKGNGEPFELYKFVYWPTLNAKRLNSSEFKERVGTWNTQSDMVGGIRQYAFEDGSTDSISTTISFSKVWIYGSKCSWCESFDLSIGDIDTKLELKDGNEGERFDTVLLYESDEFIADDYKLKLLSSGDATINCIYYIESTASTPKPTPKAIPLSIGLGQMTRSGDIKCSSNTCPSDDNLPEGTYDINSPEFYRCGTICNTSSGTFGYQFKGVKFGIIGTASPKSYSFTIDIDGENTRVNTHKATTSEYSLLYVSDNLEYKEHTINIKGNDELIELYKVVYWPSLIARRLNSSEFKERVGTWNTQSDMVGGIRQYAFEDGSTDSIKTNIWTSHIWIYGTKCSWCESFDLSIGDINTKLELREGNQGERFDTLLLYENDQLSPNQYDVTFKSSGDATLNCIYYIDLYMPSDEIIKNPEECDVDQRCVHEETENKPVTVFINVTSFTSLKNENDGSAIYIINAGLHCNKSVFINCGSGKNIGGAIYVKNELDYAMNAVELEHLSFRGCTAKCGGAVYIYSKSNINIVTIRDCNFNGNIATGSKSEKVYGGSAIYLKSSNGIMDQNSFVGNKGSGGAIKILNDFDQNSKALLLNNEQTSLIISRCLFDINSESDCSLFYASGKYGSLVELRDSIFTGKLSPGSYYINGMIDDKKSPKLVVNNCKFASDPKKSFGNSFLLTINLKNQIFNEKRMSKLISNKMILAASVSALALIGIAFVVIIKMRNQEEIETQTNSLEPSFSSLQSDENIIDSTL